MKAKQLQSMILISAVVATLTLATIISFSSLVFGTTTPDYLVTGIANFLIAGAITSILMSLFASKRGILGGMQDVPTAIAAVIAGTLATTLKGQSQEMIFSNIFVAIAISTLLTALFMILLGHFKLGNMVRFIPYPVIAGFLAASGWLLIKGGMSVAGGGTLNLVAIPEYIAAVSSFKLFLGIAFALVILTITTKMPDNILGMPASIIVSTVLFFAGAKLFGMNPGDLQSSGWLLGPMPDEPLWEALVLPKLALLNSGALIGVVGAILTVVIISAIQMLLNENGIEFATNSEIDVNKNLKRFGFINLLTVPFSTPVSFAWLGSTTLAYKMKVLHPMFGVIHGVILIIIFFIGSTVLSYFPKFIAGGMLIFLGISMVMEWLFSTRHSMQKVEYPVVILIVVSVEFLGFLTGVTIGLVTSIVIFVIRYGTSQVIKKLVDGGHYHSSKGRPIPDQRLLDYLASDTMIFQLQGYIFFGTANTLYGKIKSLTDDKRPVQVVLDFRLVSGIDSSAIVSFGKLATNMSSKDIDLIMVVDNEVFMNSFSMGDITVEKYSNLYVFKDFDKAIEKAEDKIIQAGRSKIHSSSDDEEKEFLENVFKDLTSAIDLQIEFESLIKGLKDYLTEEGYGEGDFLFKYNELNKKLFFISGGIVNLNRTFDEGKILVRIGTLAKWSITGELGALLRLPEPYNAKVEKRGVIHSLSEEKLEELKKEKPELWSRVEKLSMKMMGLQLVKTVHRA